MQIIISRALWKCSFSRTWDNRLVQHICPAQLYIYFSQEHIEFWAMKAHKAFNSWIKVFRKVNVTVSVKNQLPKCLSPTEAVDSSPLDRQPWLSHVGSSTTSSSSHGTHIWIGASSRDARDDAHPRQVGCVTGLIRSLNLLIHWLRWAQPPSKFSSYLCAVSPFSCLFHGWLT